ncbi:carboxyl transferase domain-containing protein [Actinomadura algeriensis]|uniref:acetyl-CoA carboxylase n=1 Tax=Actinomadura algeriensis TaxID=1679523 RepID=A0ABR9JM51_9ACTN|nr:carboxyl transferase domain-containing protein [Actinomadura algeriensis]MBE1531634.1 acetyl/propionyl-CoA carboxylase alpha subunit/acetyl-CoA carboxylase carboxyltransferase component [Actinomadura algeriensis]
MHGILVANRGEIAVRIARAAARLGVRSVAVHPRDDAGSLHTRIADAAHELPGEGVAAYLDAERIVAAARETGCDAVHPGYGFLSENAEFARRCAEAGLTFIGPRPELLELFGDKSRARGLAQRLGVPVVPGTRGATTLAEARAFAAEQGPVMLKALAGGGGRGMRAVADPVELDESFERCRSEALQACGNGDLYVERLLTSVRHIEVQIAGDGSGAVRHLGERDCSLQRRHQKIVEFAPSPGLDGDVRDRLFDAALRMAGEVRYEGLGTFEFLVQGDDHWFIEANPRLQVEHTVTEEVTGIDLVRTQIRLAAGASLREIGLDRAPEPDGFAVQVRVNLETLDADGAPRPRSGTLGAFVPPTGPGVRVDTYGYPGYRTSSRYDSLIAKVITRGATLDDALARAYGALGEFHVDGVPTNIPLLQGLLRHPGVAEGNWSTSFVADHLAELLEGDHRRLYFGQAEEEPAPAPTAPTAATAPEGTDAIVAPMQGTVVSLEVAEEDHVAPGAPLMVLESMKMEHVVRAGSGGIVRKVVPAKGEPVDEGAPLFFVEPADVAGDGAAGAAGAAGAGEERGPSDGGWAAEVEEIHRRREFALRMGGPEKVARQHATGRLTVRERIGLLVDPGSFAEIGSLTGFAEHDGDGRLTSLLPANFVAGTARIDGRKIVLGADDFTVRGGSGDAAIHAKQVYSEEYAREMRLPVVRLLDGASGGGSVKMATEAGFTYLPVNPAWDAVVDNLSLVPVVAACLGPTVGLGAARLVMSHLSVMVEGIGQLFTAGPPVVRGGTGEDLTKEELGGAAIHRGNGAIERFVRTEEAAFDVVRRFLSYLPGSVFELPPVSPGSDPADRRTDDLLTAVPRDPRAPYRIDPILDAVFDAGSVFRYAEYGGATVTALARLDGRPVGVIAADPFRGATMSVEGAQAITRLVDLCETFHLPIVSLTDQAGMTIGSAAERRATIRHGARAIAAVYQARVPQAELILRRVYGVGGAGIVNRHRPGRSWAWPSGDWGSLPVQGGVEAAFRAQLQNAADPEREIERLRAQLAAITSPFRTAERFGVQDLIDPRDSRALLCDWVRDAYRLLPELTGRPSFGTRP